MTRIAYVGNFLPEHSTENHVRKALGNLDHPVIPLQENTAATWDALTRPDIGVDLVLWTRTGWDWNHDCGWDNDTRLARQHDALAACADQGIPTVGFHLDRWWGLDREGQVYDEPFFGCDLVFTADGGHPDEWESAGVNHRWASPAVLRAETERVGRPSPRRYPQRLAFVGSWQSYHPEWSYRGELVRHLQRTYGRRFAAYPNQRYRTLRGQPLADLYATVPLLVGDSCLAPLADPPGFYWSDRVPETLGRGGVLVHPHVEGIDAAYPPDDSGLLTYRLGDFDDLDRVIDFGLGLSDRDRADLRARGRRWVQERHTYEVRMGEVLDQVDDWRKDHA